MHALATSMCHIACTHPVRAWHHHCRRYACLYGDREHDACMILLALPVCLNQFVCVSLHAYAPGGVREAVDKPGATSSV